MARRSYEKRYFGAGQDGGPRPARPARAARTVRSGRGGDAHGPAGEGTPGDVLPAAGSRDGGQPPRGRGEGVSSGPAAARQPGREGRDSCPGRRRASGREGGGDAPFPFQAAPLFRAPGHSLRAELDQGVYRALCGAWPLSRTHRATLAADVEALSRALTCSRAELRRPYWSSPALTSAYLYYFLPWNLVRQTRLLAGLTLPSPASAGDRPLLVDLGSGPVTVPLALWLARPEWRALPLEVVAVDCAGRPPRLGRDILEALAAAHGVRPWKVHTVQAPLARAARSLRPFLTEGRALWLVTAANVLNELPAEKGRGADGEDDDLPEEREDDRPARLLESLLPLLDRAGADACRLLFLEPGTRLGGTTLMRLRGAAREAELSVLGPCPHGGACPLLPGGDGGPDEERVEDGGDGAGDDAGMVAKIAGRAWCHFTFDCGGAPAWLTKLSDEAGLAKESLSLAWLMLGAGAGEDGGVPGAGAPDGALRVISGPFAVPGLSGSCRYACSRRGLVLCGGAGALSSGSLVTLPDGLLDSLAARDGRSGALVLRPAGEGPARAADGNDGRARDGSARRPDPGREARAEHRQRESGERPASRPAPERRARGAGKSRGEGG